MADEPKARAVARTYRDIATRVHGAGLDAYVSIKPTHFGLQLSEELCFELYADVCAHTRELGLFTRVEMEDHTTTDATLRVFARLRERFDNVGIVLQSRLFRTPADIDALPPPPVDVPDGEGHLPRADEHRPHRAGADPGRLRRLHAEALGARRHGRARDPRRADGRRAHPHRPRALVGTDRYAFEVLLGVQQQLWDVWRDAGHPVRVYVPYGPEWRAYSQRRLRKNPQIVGHVMRATARGFVGRS